MFVEPEEIYYDLATPAGQQQYREAVEQRATTWAENFEEPKQGDGDPYHLGQGDDLWIDLVERWDDEFDGDAVSDQDAARQFGARVCEQVISTLIAKRGNDKDFSRAGGDVICNTCGLPFKRHPYSHSPADLFQGSPYLSVLCDGTKVKL